MILVPNKTTLKLAATIVSTTCLSVIGTQAYAACPPHSAGTITVTGGTSSGCNLGTGGANNLVVTNTGTISENLFAGVEVDGAAGSITNSGTIDGVEGGIKLHTGTSLTSITNNTNAIINGTNDSWDSHGISVEGATISGNINNSGTISSEGDNGINIIDGSNVGNINNYGSITSDSATAIYVSDSSVVGDITNFSGSTINSTTGYGINVESATVGNIIIESNSTLHGFAYGIYSTGSTIAGILNDGTITATDSGGIRLEGTDVTGNIISNNAITSHSTNIDIVANSTVGGDVINNGSLTVDTGNGIAIRASEVTGKVENAGNIISTALSNQVSNGIFITNSQIGQLVNTGEGDIDVNGFGLYVVNNSIIDNGIVNNGTINANQNGIQVDSSVISAGGISLEGSTHGDISGLYITQSTITGDITNSSTLSGQFQGMYLGYGSIVTGNISNTGTIDGGEGVALTLDGATIDGNITNDSLMTSDQYALYIVSGSSVTGAVINNGTISGGQNSIRVENNSGDHIDIENYATLTGDVYLENATLKLYDGTIFTDNVSGGLQSALYIQDDATISTTKNFSVSEIRVQHDGQLIAAANNTFTVDVFRNIGTLNLGAVGTTTIQGDYSHYIDATLIIKADSLSQYSKLNVTGDAYFNDSGSKIFVDVGGGAVFHNNDMLANVISAGYLDAFNFNVTDNSLLYDFTAVIDGNTVDLIIAAASNASVEGAVNDQGNTPGAGAARVLDQLIANNPGGDMANVLAAFGTLGTAEEVSNAVNQVLPTLTGGSTTAVIQTLDTTGQIVQARIEQNTGLSSGDDFAGDKAIWLKPFGTWSDQSNKDNVIGFDAKSFGMIGGVDTIVSDKVRLGLAFAYAKTSVDSNNNLNSLDIDTYQAIVYGSYDLQQKAEVNFQLDFGYNQNDSSRTINFGGLNRTAEGDFDSYSVHAGTGIGRTFSVAEKTSITPSARIDYTFISNDNYSETGAGALNLNVDSQKTDQLIPSLQTKVNHDFTNSFGLTANAGVGYDVLTDENSVAASFAGGGATFTTTGLKPSPWVVKTGAGLNYKQSESLDFSLRYDREDRGTSFDAQTVSLKARMPF